MNRQVGQMKARVCLDLMCSCHA